MGKLYVNYPMVESINYTKQIPDAEYYTYMVSLADSHDFKRLAHDFSYYDGYSHLRAESVGVESARRNWSGLVLQNVQKAVYIVNGRVEFPNRKSDVCQKAIHQAQVLRYGNMVVGVLNSFPLFLYDYFRYDL